MKLAITTNEYDVPVAHYRCETCGALYTITPAPEQDEHWDNCLAPECASYDPARDIDKWFEDGGRVRAIPRGDGTSRLVPIRIIEGGKQ